MSLASCCWKTAGSRDTGGRQKRKRTLSRATLACAASPARRACSAATSCTVCMTGTEAWAADCQAPASRMWTVARPHTKVRAGRSAWRGGPHLEVYQQLGMAALLVRLVFEPGCKAREPNLQTWPHACCCASRQRHLEICAEHQTCVVCNGREGASHCHDLQRRAAHGTRS